MTTTNTTDSLSTLTLKLILKVVLSVLYTLYAAWGVQLMWAWFAVTFLSAPPLTLVMSLALVILRGILQVDTSTLMLNTYVSKQLDESTKWTYEWFGSPILTTVMIVFGATWHYIFLPILGLV